MSANMFDALADEPVVAHKPAAAAAATKPAAKAPVGGLKKSDVPKRDTQASSSQATTSGHLLGEVRKDTTKGPRHKHAPRTTQEGKIRGREFDRHSGTGRPANENKRQGGGSRNWGNVKDAQADHEAVASVPVEALEGAPAATTEASVAPVEGAEVAVVEAKVEEEEPKTQSLSSFKAERAKKQKDLESALGLGPRAEAREVKAAWYKPETKAAAPAAAAAKATTSAAKEQKQTKKYVPVSAIVGEVHAPRSDDRRGPRRERSEGGNREGGHREGGHREGGHREGGHREGGRGQRQGGNQGPRTNQGPRGPKQGKTFDATADANALPALGQ